MMKAAWICVPIVLAGAVAYVAPRVMAGSGASVGPVRAAYRCAPACEGAAPLLPPSPPPVRSFGVEHYPAPVTVPEPSTGLVFVSAVLALGWLRRRNPRAGAGSAPPAWSVSLVKLARRDGPHRRAARFFGRMR